MSINGIKEVNIPNQSSINLCKKLKDKKSNIIISEIYKFINKTFPELIEKIDDIEDISIAVQDFILQIVHDFAKTWDVEFTNHGNSYVDLSDGFESLITKSLYNQIMTLLSDRRDKKKLEKLIRKYSFVTFKHLGLEVLNIDEFELANKIKGNISLLYCRSIRD